MKRNIIFSILSVLLVVFSCENNKEMADVRELAVDYYYFPGCYSCQTFLTQKVPELEKKYDVTITINRYDANDPGAFEAVKARLNALKIPLRTFPVLILETTVLEGNDRIEKALEEVVARATGSGLPDDATTGLEEKTAIVGTDAPDTLAILPAIVAGLIDGVNPCAFSTLISLLVALTLAGKRRKEILLIGLVFTFAVLVTYYLVGLGLFSALALADSFIVISRILRWVLFGVLILFAGLSVYDYIRIKTGKTERMLLQLPGFFKDRIKRTISDRVKASAILGSALVLGFLVSVFELGCTGQVYFPFIAYTVKTDKSVLSYFILLVYNLAFILPLVIVFILACLGVNSKKFTELLKKHMGKVKIALALLFVGLAVLMFIR